MKCKCSQANDDCILKRIQNIPPYRMVDFLDYFIDDSSYFRSIFDASEEGPCVIINYWLGHRTKDKK